MIDYHIVSHANKLNKSGEKKSMYKCIISILAHNSIEYYITIITSSARIIMKTLWICNVVIYREHMRAINVKYIESESHSLVLLIILIFIFLLALIVHFFFSFKQRRELPFQLLYLLFQLHLINFAIN